MMREQTLPNFERFIREGAWGNLETILDPKCYESAALWTTVATGKHPREHGILGNTIDGALPTSNMRRVRALWNILGDHGRRVASVGYFVTWPAEEVKGFMVSDRAWADEADVTFPEGLLERLGAKGFWPWELGGELHVAKLRRFIDFDFDPAYEEGGEESAEWWRNTIVSKRLAWVYPRDEAYAHLALALWREEQPDFLVLYLQGIDFVSHGFWMYHDPDWEGYHPKAKRWLTQEETQRFGNVVRGYYAYVDEILGRWADAVDDDTLIAVASDHGFGPWRSGTWAEAACPLPGELPSPDQEEQYWYLTGNHRKDGIIALWGSGVRMGERVEGATLFDIAPTILYAMGVPIAEDMPGRVLREALDAGSRPADYVATHEHDRRPEGAPIESAVDDEITERLRGLGYVE